MADQPLSAAARGLSEAARALSGGWRLTAGLTPLGEGHINETLLVTVGPAERFVLQRISRTVFAEPARVMTNLVRVLEHLRHLGVALVPALVPTASGGWSFVDDAGGWWRLWRYVPGGRSLSRTTDPALCRSAGEAFGRFQRLLAGLPGPDLAPAIPGFLELDGYLRTFDAALSAPGAAEAVAEACGGMTFVEEHRALAGRFPRQHDLIHGDCKLNNLLFAAGSPDVLAVLDLDTVMSGHWAWDLGDLARSVLLGVGVEAGETAAAVPALDALIGGFSEGSGRSTEVGTVIDATVYVAFMLGIRFLTDHLQGDRYFRVPHPGANLRRAREQFDLVRRLTTGALADSLASRAAGRR